jgi:hypothetical protein
MATTITEDSMTSDITLHRARWSADAAADGNGAWIVTWLPLRLLTRSQAITAMTIAETVATAAADRDSGRQEFAGWRLQVDQWAAELALTGPEAIDKCHAGEQQARVMLP